ncbi:MAG: FAD-dependent monooxygenase [Lentisphaerota bacterium]
MENFYDVIIIGAGPSGAAAAISLGRNSNNLRILLVDKAIFPRDKVCGDGLTGDSIRCLKELGIWDKIKEQGHSMDRVELYPFQSDNYINLEANVVTIPRKCFDLLLFNEALKNDKISFKNAAFYGEIREKKGAYQTSFIDSISGNRIIIDSNFVIIATGCQADKHLYSMRTIPYTQPDAVLIRGYYRAEWDLHNPIAVFLNFSKKGYFWAFPMGDNLFNVGCGFKSTPKAKADLKFILNENIAKLNSKYHTEGVWQTDPKGAFIRSGLKNYKKFSYSNILFVGETIASTYPYTGEGIGKALETGILASLSIQDALNKKGRKAAFYYNKSIAKIIIPMYKPYRMAEHIFVHRYISSFCFKLLYKSKIAQLFVSNVLTEKVVPSSFYIIRGILKLTFKRFNRK